MLYGPKKACALLRNLENSRIWDLYSHLGFQEKQYLVRSTDLSDWVQILALLLMNNVVSD